LLKTQRKIIRESQKIDEKSGEDTNQSKEFFSKNYQKK